jgi:aspartate/tyrosine/aromatic aminotransferase
MQEYIPIDGIPGYVSGSQKLIFGKDSSLLKEGRVCSAQTLSGTGALRVIFDFIKQELPSTVLVPSPTWANHQNIIKRAGLEVQNYPYYDPSTKKVNIDGLLKCLDNAKEGNIVLLHACAHNPTGVDPT